MERNFLRKTKICVYVTPPDNCIQETGLVFKVDYCISYSHIDVL